jgi:hypothetical protein
MAESFTQHQPMLGIAHGDLRLVCGCSAMETHFMKLVTNSSCADVASRGSLELGSECCNQGQTIFTRYHFTITALWQGQLARATLAGQKYDERLGEKVESYDGAMLKVIELFSEAILLLSVVYGDCMAVCSIYTPISNGCG